MAIDRSVAVGISTVVGFASAAATAVMPFVGELADTTEPLGVPSSVWVVVSTLLAIVTIVGRMWQAGKMAGEMVVEPVPHEGGADEPPMLP